jgi:hypothetical protein
MATPYPISVTPYSDKKFIVAIRMDDWIKFGQDPFVAIEEFQSLSNTPTTLDGNLNFSIT